LSSAATARVSPSAGAVSARTVVVDASETAAIEVSEVFKRLFRDLLVKFGGGLHVNRTCGRWWWDITAASLVDERVLVNHSIAIVI